MLCSLESLQVLLQHRTVSVLMSLLADVHAMCHVRLSQGLPQGIPKLLHQLRVVPKHMLCNNNMVDYLHIVSH